MITQAGVYLDIDESDIYLIFGNNLKFYFSSKFNINRFREKVGNYIDVELSKIKNKYQITDIDLKLFFAIVFYTKIEKRGFKIIDLDKDILYHKKEDIKFIIKIKE